ncbi:MAG: glycosyltransferase, partial [Anaerolineae bacterium]|nr:glycosyltransferase [Anaerolineae bacterium]
RTVAQAAHIVISGDGWRDAFLRRWPVDDATVTTVENGTELVHLLAREQLRAFQEKSVSEEPVTIAYLGGFQPWQGVPLLLRALARLQAQVTPFHLILIGSGQGEAEAQQLTRQLGLSGVVTLTGRLPQEKYAPLLAQADIGVAPYCDWPEYSGLKLFDYKAAGLAVIGSGENGYPRTLAHGRSGWIVPPCDEKALARAIGLLVEDSALRRQLGQAARLEAERIHGWEQTTQRLEQIMSDVLSKREQTQQLRADGQQGFRVT